MAAHTDVMSDVTPFRKRPIAPSNPTLTLHRFTKPGYRAEIRERQVLQFHAVEYIVFVDGAMSDSELFHGGRAAEYPAAIATRIAEFVADGWIEVPADRWPHIKRTNRRHSRFT